MGRTQGNKDKQTAAIVTPIAGIPTHNRFTHLRTADTDSDTPSDTSQASEIPDEEYLPTDYNISESIHSSSSSDNSMSSSSTTGNTKALDLTTESLQALINTINNTYMQPIKKYDMMSLTFKQPWGMHLPRL